VIRRELGKKHAEVTFIHEILAFLEDNLQALLEILLCGLGKASNLSDDPNGMKIAADLFPVLFLHHATANGVEEFR
jgi:hypothetical protein